MIKFYTDGSCRSNGKENNSGGWAYIIIKDGSIIGKECEQVKNTTNNKMELTALLRACEKALLYEREDRIEFYMDSAYIHNCISQGWYRKWRNNGWLTAKKEPVKNRELWELLIPFFENERFHFYKVKGHSEDFYNNIVDELAVGGIKE